MFGYFHDYFNTNKKSEEEAQNKNGNRVTREEEKKDSKSKCEEVRDGPIIDNSSSTVLTPLSLSGLSSEIHARDLDRCNLKPTSYNFLIPSIEESASSTESQLNVSDSSTLEYHPTAIVEKSALSYFWHVSSYIYPTYFNL